MVGILDLAEKNGRNAWSGWRKKFGILDPVKKIIAILDLVEEKNGCNTWSGWKIVCNSWSGWKTIAIVNLVEKNECNNWSGLEIL